MDSEITIEWIIVYGTGVGFALYTVASLFGYGILKALQLFHIVSNG